METTAVPIGRSLRCQLGVAALSSFLAVLLPSSPAAAQGAPDACAPRTPDAGQPRTVDAGTTGFAVKRPVLASACEHGCPWGELGDYVEEAMRPLGYDVVQCRNCNLDNGPRLVANASRPPALGFQDTFVGTLTRINAPVDFGITSSGLLAWAYDGLYDYQGEPYPNLRLIANIDDPSYLLVAVKAESCITDLSQIAKRKLPVKILGGGSPISQPILDYYGLTQAAVTSWGGTFEDAILFGQADDPAFDIVITENASPAQNPESAYWTKVSQKHNLRFLDLPESVLATLAGDKTLGVVRVTAKWGLLRGVDRAIDTVGRTGHSVFARDDMPDQVAYDTAKAIDAHRDALKWYIRPYSYDSRTVWTDLDVPLHPGAKRYYSDAGYLTGSAGGEGCVHDASVSSSNSAHGGAPGCAVGGARRSPRALWFAGALGALLTWKRRRRAA